MRLTQHQITLFQEDLWEHYALHGRPDLPWRLHEPSGSFDPYKILVSEMMLQQTQVARVIPKYLEFLQRFPDIFSLADANLGDVLRMWQGLGYNRRAKFLWQAAQEIVGQEEFPRTQSELVKLPGIGPNTAGAILAYGFNSPAVFIETNVRTVFLHHFFVQQENVPDKDIIELVKQTLDLEHPREFYWALMDYGSYLKATIGNLNQASKHYVKQSKFQGSKRQLRGQIIRLLGNAPMTEREMIAQVSDERLADVLRELSAEGLIRENQGKFSLE
jgi:A/G-specific adenine glycosylase